MGGSKQSFLRKEQNIDYRQDSSWDFETELSQHTTAGMLSRHKDGKSLLETRSHSVDLWLQDHFSDGAGSQEVGDNLNIGMGEYSSKCAYGGGIAF